MRLPDQAERPLPVLGLMKDLVFSKRPPDALTGIANRLVSTNPINSERVLQR